MDGFRMSWQVCGVQYKRRSSFGSQLQLMLAWSHVFGAVGAELLWWVMNDGAKQAAHFIHQGRKRSSQGLQRTHPSYPTSLYWVPLLKNSTAFQ